MSKSKASRDRISKKIKHLIDEGIPDEQAVAMALSMERAGRISPSGKYIPVKKKIKTASFESIDTQHHIAHFIKNEDELDYVDEEYPESEENPVEFALRVIIYHSNKFGANPEFDKDTRDIFIKNIENGEYNIFRLSGFNSDEIEEVKRLIK